MVDDVERIEVEERSRDGGREVAVGGKDGGDRWW